MKMAKGWALGLGLLCAGAHVAPVLADTNFGEWRVRGFLDNDTRYRKDVGEGQPGLSKLRLTTRFDADRKLPDVGPLVGSQFNIKLRATYDGIYDISPQDYGKKAGRAVCLNDTSGFFGANGCVPHGQGAFGGTDPATGKVGNAGYGPFYYLPLGFGFNSSNPDAPRYNPNEGLIILGEPLHKTHGGVAFGIPARPCNVDSRGCLKGYLDYTENGLRFPDFQEPQRFDWLREISVQTSLPVGEQEIAFSIGKQQVIWGRSDLFRVLDIINPVDFARNNIYEELQDIRRPMFIATAEYRMGGLGPLADANLQFVWNFDKFRPNDLGLCGSTSVPLGAGCLFRGLKNLWENGGTVSNFALNPPAGLGDLPGVGVVDGLRDLLESIGADTSAINALAVGTGRAPPSLTTDFGPHQIGIRDVELPKWNLSNTQYGTKFEGVAGPIAFSLNAFSYRAQLPTLQGGDQGPFTDNPFTPGIEADKVARLIAFDVQFPRVKLIGGSVDFTIDYTKTIHRIEFGMTWGEKFADTLSKSLRSESRVARYVIGLDRLGFIKPLNPDRTFLFSGQLFGQHILDHNDQRRPLGKVGIPDPANNWIATFYMQTWYMQDRIQPKFVMAYDYKAHAFAVQPFGDYLITQNLKLTVGANIKFGEAAKKFNDCRDCNPYPPFTNYPVADGGSGPGSLADSGPVGVQSEDPLGIFKSFVLGTADKEDEVFASFSYGFF